MVRLGLQSRPRDLGSATNRSTQAVVAPRGPRLRLWLGLAYPIPLFVVISGWLVLLVGGSQPFPSLESDIGAADAFPLECPFACPLEPECPLDCAGGAMLLVLGL